jgi:hypothetical protein
MPIEDYVAPPDGNRSRQPPSRARTRLQALRVRLEAEPDQNRVIALFANRKATVTTLIGEIDEMLGEWVLLDNLTLQLQLQRKHIATRAAAAFELAAVLQVVLPLGPPRKRARLSSAQRVIAMAKGRITRKLRNTMGKRQRQKLGL